MDVHLVLIKHLSPPPSIFKLLADSDNKLLQICDALKYLVIELQAAKILVAVS
jgi:hypothetical protein